MNIELKMLWLLVCLALVWGFPNVSERYGQGGTHADRRRFIEAYKPAKCEALVLGFIFGLVMITLWTTEVPPQFIYFAF